MTIEFGSFDQRCWAVQSQHSEHVWPQTIRFRKNEAVDAYVKYINRAGLPGQKSEAQEYAERNLVQVTVFKGWED